MAIPARVSIVTLGVADVARSVAFYRSLGWEQASSSNDEIAWFRTADTYIGLFGRDALAHDAKLPSTPRAPFGGITLAINVESGAAVSAALDAVVRSGAKLLKAPERADWGGFSGYFADPDGHPWEVAYNPHFSIGTDGRITIP